jgi:hypothetical protein
MGAGLYEDVVPAVHAHSRRVIQDNIAGAGLKEPKPPRLRVHVSGEHAQHRVIKAILGRAQVVTVQLKAQAER